MTDPALEARLRRLLSVFVEENTKLNLSAFRTEETAWVGNILDSLPFLDIVPALPPFSAVLDLGTGGGFPMLPLALALPGVRFTGLDSVQKKVDATNRIIEAASVTNAICLCGRAEDLGRMSGRREKFDIVLSRAVAEINVLLEYASPFVKPGGRVVLWKSLTIEEELKDSLVACGELSCRLAMQHAYELPGDWGKRQLLVYEKTGKLSGKYPRDVGVPKKKPLK